MPNYSPDTTHLMPPWKPGESGNPAGRKTRGALLKECVNALSLKNLSIDELRAMLADKALGELDRWAVVRVLRSHEHPDMADFEPVLDGQMSLREMRAEGRDTTAIKKVKTRRVVTRHKGSDETEEEVTREIELHDRSLAESQFLMESTEGRPKPVDGDVDPNPFRLLVSINIGADTAQLQQPTEGEGGEVSQVHLAPIDAVALPPRAPNSAETGQNP